MGAGGEAPHVAHRPSIVELERFTATVGPALAERIGADSDDPEVTLTAIAIAGLARVWARATFIHIQRVSSMTALGDAVRNDMNRALRLATPTLTAFDDLGGRPDHRAGSAQSSDDLSRAMTPRHDADEAG